MIVSMSVPLDFRKNLAGELREAVIPFAITSGMAGVHGGVQETTKDSDWIIPDDSLDRLRTMLSRLEDGRLRLRIHDPGGSFELDSAPGRGTRVGGWTAAHQPRFARTS